MNIKSAIPLFFLLFSLNIFSQDVIEPTKYSASNKGKFLIFWGGNRESFSRSDITFEGDNYKFTIEDASAHDKPKGWHIDYINPTRITIPQTNLKVGYFISDHYLISAGVDHMKYVMNRNRNKIIDGYINLPEEEVGSQYNGTYDHELYFVSEDFLKFEHTNGLNYIYLQLERFDDISNLFGLPNIDKFQINLTEGFGGGILYPKTNTTLLEKDRYDEFHLSGYGVSFTAGLNFRFFKYFFIQGDLKGGYIDMNDIRTTSNVHEKASQHFWFLQRTIGVGGIFNI